MKLINVLKLDVVIERIVNNYIVFSLLSPKNWHLPMDIPNFTFTVPLGELNGAKIERIEKASMFMKWIKPQYLDYITREE